MTQTITRTIPDLVHHHTLADMISLDTSEFQQALYLALLTLESEGVSLDTDGLFGRTRSGASTCTVLGFTANSRSAYKSAISHIHHVVRQYAYSKQPDVIDAKQARRETKNAERNLRAEANKQRNADRESLKALILQAYANGDLGKVRSHKAIANRDRLLSKLPAELPVLTAGRELFKMLSYWGLTSHVQNPYAVPWQSITTETPLKANIDEADTDTLFRYIAQTTSGRTVEA